MTLLSKVFIRHKELINSGINIKRATLLVKQEFDLDEEPNEILQQLGYRDVSHAGAWHEVSC